MATQFLGVTLIKWGYRPRKSVKAVYVGSSTVGLLANGNVATTLTTPFEPRRLSKPPYTNGSLADDLHALGVITKKACEQHKADAQRAYEAHWAMSAADELESYGVKLTKAQHRKVSKLATIKGA